MLKNVNREPVTRRVRTAVVLTALALVVPLTVASTGPATDGRLSHAAALTPVGDPRLPSAVGPRPDAPAASMTAAGATRPVTGRGPAPTPVDSRDASVTGPAPAVKAVEASQRSASILGTVVDATGGRLPGAQVTLVNVDSGGNVITTTDGSGRFAFGELTSPQYVVVLSLPGFATVSHTLRPSADDVTTRTFTLPVGTVQELITTQGCFTAQAGRGVTVRDAWARLLQAAWPVMHAQTPVRIGGQLQAPRKLVDARPVCPERRPPGTIVRVHVMGQIQEDGSVGNLVATAVDNELAPAAFTQAVVDMALKWRFTPTLLNGVPIPVNLSIQVIFQ